MNEKPTDTFGFFVERDEDHILQSSLRLKLPNGKQYPYFNCVLMKLFMVFMFC